MRVHLLIILILLVCSATSIFPIQPYTPQISNPILEPWRWKHFTKLNGKGVRCMTEGKDHSMWFGVDRGVMRYDGYTWQLYTLDDSLAGISVNVLYTDHEGSIYAGTDRGLYQFHRNKWKRIFPLRNDIIFEVSAIIELDDRSIVVGFGDRDSQNINSGLLHIKNEIDIFYGSKYTIDNLAQYNFSNIEWQVIPQNIVITNQTNQTVFNVLDIYQNDQKLLFVGVSDDNNAGKIVVFDYDGDKLILNNVYTEKDGLLIRSYVKITQSKDKRICVISNAHEKGINFFDGVKWSNIRLSDQFGGNDSQFSILAASDGTLWVDGHGKFFAFQNEQWYLYKSPEVPLPTTSRVLFFETSDGSMWIAGKQNEVFKLDYGYKTWTTFKNLNFQCETTEYKCWFLSVDGRAVLKQDNEWYSYGKEDGLMDAPVTIFVTSYGEVWAAGSDRGIAATAYFDNDTWHVQRHPQLSWGIDYRAVFEAKDGSLWFGCSVDLQIENGQLGGVLCLKNPAKNKTDWIHYSANQGIGTAYGIGQSKDGLLWIGGRPLWTFDGNSWQIFNEIKALKHYVDIIENSPTGDLWLGSRHYGLFRYDSKNWTQFSIAEGLVSNSIISIFTQNDSSVWVATDKDICHFDGNTWLTNIFPDQMTMSREGGSIVGSAGGHLWINRSSRDWKRRALTGQTTKKKAFEDFWTIRYNGDQHPPDTKITVYSDEVGQSGNTSIFWEGNDYWEVTPKEKLQFSFRLNDGEWSSFQSLNHHTFLSLNPGTYQLEVRARDLDFNIDPTTAQIQFEVMAPLWQQPIFVGLMAIVVCVIILLEIRVLRRDRKLRKLNEALSDRTGKLEMYSHQLEQKKDKIEHQRDQLQKMITKVQQLSQMRLRFFTNISHEFRTPLTLILGPVEKLLSYESKQNHNERNKLYCIIQRNAQRLLRLINQILEIYKVEEGTLVFNPQQGDIVKFIKEIFSLFTSLAKQRRLKYIFSTSNDSIVTFFDYDKIEKILFNLLSNSFKNTPEKGTISVNLSLVSSNGRSNSKWIQISVEDTGKGIPAEHIDHIFELFYQVNNSNNSHQHLSSGIGLTYIKDLVKTHQGKITVKSNPGIETVFTIQIPLITQIEATGEMIPEQRSLSDNIKPALEELSRSLISPPKEQKTEKLKERCREKDVSVILIVDDDRDVREYLKNCLANSYNIEEAGDGIEGLEKAGKIQPELIISDVMMPQMDGIEFCKQLKTNFNTSHVPVILLTARNLVEQKVEGLDIGADDYIEKPFDSRLLESRIKNLISSRQKLKQRFMREIQLQPKDITMTSVDELFLNKAIEVVEKNMDNPDFDSEKMCREVGVSRVQLYRKLKALTGQTVNQFIKSIRMKHAARLLIHKKLTVAEVAYEVGFSEHSNFTTYFRNHFGLSPSAYIQHHKKI